MCIMKGMVCLTRFQFHVFWLITPRYQYSSAEFQITLFCSTYKVFAFLVSLKGADQESGWSHPGTLERFE